MKSDQKYIHLYSCSYVKRLFDIFSSLVLLLIVSPVFILISILVLFFSGIPIFFLQRRIGRNGKIFKIIKFRTMVKHALQMQKRYKKLNEADGPVFKIMKDPRFTKIGYILSRTGLDELPQFINVLKGEMSIVGPRPLPVSEASKLSKTYKIRELVKPGITSTWVTNGSHNLAFKKWMSLDIDYVKNASFLFDLEIIYETFYITLRSIDQLLKKI